LQIEEKAESAVQHNEDKLHHWQEQTAYFDQLERESKRVKATEGLRRDVLKGSVTADEEWAAQQDDYKVKHSSYGAQIRSVQMLIAKTSQAMQTCHV
jgi:hypothetical protein